MRKIIIIPALTAAIALMLMTGGCQKPTTTITTTNTADSIILVGFHFHSFIGANLVDPYYYPSLGFADSSGRVMHLQVAQFYVSNIAIHLHGTSTWVPIANDVIMKRIQNEVYPLGYIPGPPANNSNYMDSVRFTVGIGNVLNAMNPSGFLTSSPTDSVLAPGSQAYTWMDSSGMTGMTGMASGYTFMSIQGYDSTDHLPFSYQIGGYGDTVNVVLAYSAGFNFVPVLTGNSPNLIHIVADYGKLLEAIPSMNAGNTFSTFYGSNPAPSQTLLNAIKNMFRWECTPPINC